MSRSESVSKTTELADFSALGWSPTRWGNASDETKFQTLNLSEVDKRGNVSRPERPLDPTAGPLQAFAHKLRMLRRQAGSPSYRVLAERVNYSVATLAEAARGLHKPSLEVAVAYVEACGADPEPWIREWSELTKVLDGLAESRQQSDRSAPAEPIPVQRRKTRSADPGAPDPRGELDKLRQEVVELRRANAVLKAAAAIFAADLDRRTCTCTSRQQTSM